MNKLSKENIALLVLKNIGCDLEDMAILNKYYKEKQYDLIFIFAKIYKKNAFSLTVFDDKASNEKLKNLMDTITDVRIELKTKDNWRIFYEVAKRIGYDFE